MNADPDPSVCYSSPNDQSQTVGTRLTVSWPRAHDSTSSAQTQKCGFGNKPAAADPFYHSSNTETQELLDLKLQIVRQKAKFDKLSSRLKQCEFKNKVLEADLRHYITSSAKYEQVINTLQKENELLQQKQQQQFKVKVKEPSASSSVTVPGIHHYLDSMDEDINNDDDCSTLPALDSSHSRKNREYINMLVNEISANDWLILTNNGEDNNKNMETTSTTINKSYLPYLPRSNRRNSEPVENASLSSNKVLPPPIHDAPSRMSSKARESRFDIRRLCSSLTDRRPHHRVISSKQSDDLLVDFCKGPRSQQDTAALNLRWSFKS